MHAISKQVDTWDHFRSMFHKHCIMMKFNIITRLVFIWWLFWRSMGHSLHAIFQIVMWKLCSELHQNMNLCDISRRRRRVCVCVYVARSSLTCAAFWARTWNIKYNLCGDSSMTSTTLDFDIRVFVRGVNIPDLFILHYSHRQSNRFWHIFIDLFVEIIDIRWHTIYQWININVWITHMIVVFSHSVHLICVRV